MGKGKPKKEMTFEERVEKFEKYYADPEQHYKIFSELGFSYVEDGCDGFCPECEQKKNCKTCAEIGWDKLDDEEIN
jgi:hypothetical protein